MRRCAAVAVLTAALLLALFSVAAMAQPLLPEHRDGAPELRAPSGRITAHVFKSANCPHCSAQRLFLDALAARHEGFDVRYYEIVETTEHHPLLFRMTEAFGVDPGSVPMVFLADSAWVGDSGWIRQDIEARLLRCLADGCPDARALAEDAGAGRVRIAERVGGTIRLPGFGDIDLAVQPLLVSTAIIAFVDGFNPCSLWLLTILIALVLHSGSRKRVLVVGSVFLTATAAVYGLFMIGVFGVLAYAEYLPWMYWIVGLFALTFGLVNVKDYFWFKRGLSFTIDDRHKPGIFRNFRELIRGGRSYWALAGATLVMALGIALVELPCTAGFPVIWGGLISAHDVNPMVFFVLLLTYLTIYLLDELIVFGVAVIKLRIDRFEERQARLLKLLGGVVMIALAIVLITDPDIMSSIGPALAVFAVAFAVTGSIVVAHRFLLPRLGIRIGDGDAEGR